MNARMIIIGVTSSLAAACGPQVAPIDWESVGTLRAVSGGNGLNAQGQYATQLYAAADGGRILWHDGDDYRLIQTPSRAELRGIAARPAQWVAVGCNAEARAEVVIGSRDQWIEQPIEARCLNAIAGFSGGLLAVGDGGEVVTSDAWSAEAQSISTDNLYGVDIVAWDLAIAVGDRGTILRRTDLGWERMSSPVTTRLNAVHLLGRNSAYAVGEGGVVLRYDGSSWTQLVSPTTAALTALAFAPSHDPYGRRDGNAILASAKDGSIIQELPRGWHQIPTDSIEELLGLWTDESVIEDPRTVAVGARGTLLELTRE